MRSRTEGPSTCSSGPQGSASFKLAHSLSSQGRIEIYQVHARNKQLAPGTEFDRIARATAGYTGADIMNLMNQAAILTTRAVRVEVIEWNILISISINT